MKTHTFFLMAGAVILLAMVAPISGQNAVRLVPQAEVSPEISALIDQLTEQNKQLTANQEAMDAKIDELTETIRQARIFAARAGGKGSK